MPDGFRSNMSPASRRNSRLTGHPKTPTSAVGTVHNRRRNDIQKTTVALLDDDVMARQELRAALARVRGLRIVGDATRGDELFALLEETHVDMVVLDILLRHDNSLDVIRQLRHLHPAVKIVVVTNQLDESLLLAGLRAGAHGYLDRREGPTRIAAALRLVGRGERVLPDQRAITHVVRELERLARADVQLRIGLTPEERELLALVAEGRSNQDIAGVIGCSLATVKRHLTLIFGKLQAHDRTGAINEALRQGVL